MSDQHLPPHLDALRNVLSEQEQTRRADVELRERLRVSSLPVVRAILGVIGVEFALGSMALWMLGSPEVHPRALGVWFAAASTAFSAGIVPLLLGGIFFARRREEQRRDLVRTGRTAGLIVSTDLERMPAGRGGGYVARVVVLFQYEVAGRTLSGEFRPEFRAHRRMHRHETTRRKYPPGTVIQVAYNPAHPTDSSIDRPHPPIVGWAVLTFGVGCSLVSASLVLGTVAVRMLWAIIPA